MNPHSAPSPSGPSGPQGPIYHSSHLTYGTYLRVSGLLELQQPRSQHHDELLFIIAHQVYELWFKQLLHEMEAINAALDADQPLRAAKLFDRVHKVQHLLIEQIPLLETMYAADFAKFRDQLRPASGFQSVQFRKLEFLCGNKSEKFLALVGEDEAAKAEMAAYLGRPTPYDHFLRHLSREDRGVFAIPRDALERDTRQPHELNTACAEALARLYRLQEDADAIKGGERYFAQYRVCEHLIEFDEKLAIWRFHHVKMVERMIGGLTGTGGSSGAKYLWSTLQRPLYPDLWAVRTTLGAGGPGGDGPGAGPGAGPGMGPASGPAYGAA